MVRLFTYKDYLLIKQLSMSDSTHYQSFTENLHLFLKTLHRYVPNEGCQKLIDNFDKLDINRILIRYIGLIGGYATQLKNKDESMFAKSCVPLPGVHLDRLWVHLNDRQKSKVFTFMHMLLVLADMIIKEEQAKSSSVVTTNNKSEFNPYTGVGSDNNYSVEEMFSNMDCLKDASSGGGNMAISMIMSKLGLGSGALSIKSLKDQIDNISDEEVNGATDALNKMLGGDNKDLVNSLVTNIKNGVESMDDSEDANPIAAITQLMQTISTNMRDTVDNNDVLSNLVNKAADENGGANPMDGLMKMMGGLSGGGDSSNEVNEEVDGEVEGGNREVEPVAELMGGSGDNPMAGLIGMFGAMNGAMNGDSNDNPMAGLMSMLGGAMNGGAMNDNNPMNMIGSLLGALNNGDTGNSNNTK